jgi:hypothetical protein
VSAFRVFFIEYICWYCKGASLTTVKMLLCSYYLAALHRKFTENRYKKFHMKMIKHLLFVEEYWHGRAWIIEDISLKDTDEVLNSVQSCIITLNEVNNKF